MRRGSPPEGGTERGAGQRNHVVCLHVPVAFRLINGLESTLSERQKRISAVRGEREEVGADLNEDGLALKAGQHYREKLCGLLSSFEAIGTLSAFDETLAAYCGTYETAQKKIYESVLTVTAGKRSQRTCK